MTDQTAFSHQQQPLSGRAMRQWARRLGAYLPLTVTRQILTEQLPQPGQMMWIRAATLFTDMSGFTRMAEALAAEGPRGAEQLNQTLLMTFTSLINAIHDAGGRVAHFHGDAMLVYFPDEDGQAASRALGCARFMQSLMSNRLLPLSTSKLNQSFSLTMRIGVGYGRCFETIVGDPAGTMEFVLAGTAVDEAVMAESQALQGQVVASQHALRLARLPAERPFRVVTEVPPVPRVSGPFYWESFSQEALENLVSLAPAFIPAALVKRLENPNTQFIAEHRPASSLFVRFAGIDFTDDRAGEQLQTYYQWAWSVVKQFAPKNGRVNRVLTGDKGSHLHIIFGAPVAPDDPENGVRCALELQRTRPDFITRQQIGMSNGRVFACAVGSQNRREYTIVGSVVNLSSRLTSLAADGEVLLDEATAARVAKRFQYDTIPDVIIKGIADPVTLYRPTAEKTVAMQAIARFATDQPLLMGRDEEMERLEAHLELGLQQHGGVVMLSGPHGSGQMAMLGRAAHLWQSRQGRVLVSICQQQLYDVPFAPWQSIWRQLFGITPKMNARQIRTAVYEQSHRLLSPELATDPSLWGELLGMQNLLSATAQAIPVEQRHRTMFLLAAHLLNALSQEQPLLIILEDVHWADQLSLNLIEALAPELARQTAVLLITSRHNGELGTITANQVNVVNIPLNDLPPDRARSLIQKRLGVESLPPLLEKRLGIRDRQGRQSLVNPLFLEESLNSMMASGILRVDKTAVGENYIRFQETALLHVQVPDTVHAILLSRLDQLTPSARGFLQVASVIGRAFDLDLVMAIMSDISLERAEQLVQELSEAEMIQPDPTAGETAYIFNHALTHDVVYQSLPYARRQTLHAAIGEWLRMAHRVDLTAIYPLLAYHFGQTDQHEVGLKYAVLAADEAAARFANSDAADLYRTAVEHLSVLDEPTYWQTAVHVYVGRARTLRWLGEYSKATSAAADALKLCLMMGDLNAPLPVYILLAQLKQDQGAYEDALSFANKVLNSLSANPPPLVQAQAYLIAGKARLALGFKDEALTLLDEAERLAVTNSDQALLANVWQEMAQTYVAQQRPRLAKRTASEAVTLTQAHGSAMQVAMARFSQSQISLRLGEASAALASINQAISQIQNMSVNWRARMLLHKTAVLLYLGRLDEVRDGLTYAINLFERMDDQLGLIHARLLWGRDYCRTVEDWQTAREQLSYVGQILASDRSETKLYAAESIQLWLGLAHVALARNATTEAVRVLMRAHQTAVSQRLTWWLPELLWLMGRQQLADQQPVETVAATWKTAVSIAQTEGCPEELPLIYLSLSELPAETAVQHAYLERCAHAALARARHRDQLTCLDAAGRRLLESDMPQLRQLGQQCLNRVATQHNDQEAE